MRPTAWPWAVYVLGRALKKNAGRPLLAHPAQLAHYQSMYE